ncbi:MAG TPA: hypothetical protein VHS96_01485 [Bacteroidia bacterium]|nr:hypothetical protein [Bacteroidia bacterium]
MRKVCLLFFLVLAAMMGCGEAPVVVGDQLGECACVPPAGAEGIAAGTGGLIATRFKSLEELKIVVQIEYFTKEGKPVPEGEEASMVRVIHCSKGRQVTGILESGISQDDIVKVQNGSFLDRLNLVFQSPYAVANREDLGRVYFLARRVPLSFGGGDLAFYDLAETSVANINTPNLAFKDVKDTSEKGYINSFNHITAQAFICSIFSEELANFVADLHERKNMRELTTGKFTENQLSNPVDNPVDNYVDIVNNEWGQELGNRLRKKYHISRDTWWTSELLSDYLNDIQGYYGWAFQIGLKPFRPEDEFVARFSSKINTVMRNKYGGY